MTEMLTHWNEAYGMLYAIFFGVFFIAPYVVIILVGERLAERSEAKRIQNESKAKVDLHKV